MQAITHRATQVPRLIHQAMNLRQFISDTADWIIGLAEESGRPMVWLTAAFGAVVFLMGILVIQLFHT